MAQEEKLKYFYDSTMNALKAKNDAEIESMRSKLEQDLSEYKKSHAKELANQEALHEAEIKRELLKSLAAEKLKVRREQSRVEAVTINKLFKEVGEKLDEFRATDGYKDSLKACIKKILKFAGDDEVIFYICASDAHLKDALEDECKVNITLSDVPFNGGIQAEIPSRNIFINDSYSSKMTEKKRAYLLKVK